MAVRTKVRLVRCPNCQNVLSELPDYSVYRCGGCSTILQAKKKLTVSDGLLEKPGTERDGEGFEKLESLSEKEGGDLVNASETEREQDRVIHARRKERVFGERTVKFVNNSLSRTENKDATIDDSNRNVKELNIGHQSDAVRQIGFNDKCSQPLKHPIDNLVHLKDYDIDMNRSKSVNSSIGKGIGDISAQVKISPGSLRSRVIGDQRGLNLNRDGLRGSYSNLRIANDCSKFSTFAYPDEGPSNYNLAASYGHGKPAKGYDSLGGPNKVAHLEQDPAELLRKLDELKEQLSRFCAVAEQQTERRVVVTHENRRPCHPIAGGAPFITCYTCSELLKLPRRLKTREKNQQKLQCGACSAVVYFEIQNKRLVISFHAENKQALAEDDGGSCDTKEVLLSSNGSLNAGGMNYSDDFDPGYDFQSLDLEDSIISKDPRLHLSKSDKRQGHTSSSSISSEEEESLGGMILQRDVSYHPQLSTKEDVSPTFQVSHFQEHLDDASSNCQANRCGNGNRSKWTDQGRVVLDKNTSWQNSVKDVSLATVVEVPFDECPNTNLSQDSVEVRKEEYQSRINKWSESLLVGVIKKSFRDFSRSNQCMENEKCNVLVNGKPIPDHMVKKAEKLAGPIHPGDYWYDFRAGFWGVMGHPCLGIVPPSIKEFNFPMPEDCAAGNTGVFVNGRELHQNDLDLLADRGLPTVRDKFYIIEISGRVLDKDSGKELCCLGKLAPTVEKLKRGFGMKVPGKLVCFNGVEKLKHGFGMKVPGKLV